MSIAQKLERVAQNQQKVFDAGKEAQKSDFWKQYFAGLNRYGNYYWAFAGSGWNDDIYQPTQTIRGHNMNYLFYYSDLTDTKVDVDLTLSPTTNKSALFQYSKLKTIRKLIVCESNTLPAFTGCTNLENITFDGVIAKSVNMSACSKLTNASVQSVIDHLKDLTGEATQVFTVHQTVRDAMTAEQVHEVENVKNWTLAPSASAG